MFRMLEHHQIHHIQPAGHLHWNRCNFDNNNGGRGGVEGRGKIDYVYYEL